MLKFNKHRQREMPKAGGKLIYLCIYLSHTRLDITYAVTVVSQFMHDPRKLHMDDVKRILRYLKSTSWKLKGRYTDAD